jgi:hypothetical protein
MTPETALKVASEAAAAVLDAKDGKPIDAARHAASALLELVPHETALQLLTDEQVRRANDIANAAEAVKFGLDDPGDEETKP